MPKWLKEAILFLNGFRKWSIMFILISVGISFRITGFLSGQEFVELLRYTTVAFMASNSIEHVTKAVVEWVKRKTYEN